MGRRCTVCDHPKRAEIERAAASDSAPLRAIARQHGIGRDALQRHVAHHMAKALAKAHERVEAVVVREVVERRAAQGIADLDLYGVVVQYHERVLKLFDACDRWLTDPREPGQYNLDPRAFEIDVGYMEQVGERDDGTPIMAPRVATLQAMLDRVAGLGDVVAVKYRVADPRALVLRTAQLLQAQVKAISAILAAKPPESDEDQLARSPSFRGVRDAIVGAVKPFPDALRAVLGALRRVERSDEPGE